MFERFTERAREVMVEAGRLAKEEKSPSIRRHHLLVGLIDAADEGSQSVATVFADANVDTAELRAKLLESLRASEEPLPEAASAAPFTREAKKTLELSLREALSLGHNYIGREHLLLGILRDASGPLGVVIDASGLKYDRAREIVAEASPPSVGRRGGRDFRTRIRGRSRQRSSTFEVVLTRAMDRSKGRRPTTGDLLVALLEAPGTHFHAALAGSNLPTADAAAQSVDKLIADKVPDGVEGAIRVDEDAVTINDPQIASEIRRLVGDKVTPEAISEILRRLKD
jgi:ATP-dependent Clp protease ATP-binding subunit ClpA